MSIIATFNCEQGLAYRRSFLSYFIGSVN